MNESDDIKNISIIGTGAMGCLWASNLDSKLQIHLIDRHFTKDILPQPKESIHIELLTPSHKKNFCFDLNQPLKLHIADYLLVTVKAYDVVNTIEQFIPLIKKSVVIIILHNGMGTKERLNELMPDNLLLFMNTTHGCYLNSKSTPHNKLLHFAQSENSRLGESYIGAFNHFTRSYKKQLIPLIKILDQCLPKVHWLDNIDDFLWQKLAVNAIINPLATLYRCKNGELLNKEYQFKIKQLIHEVSLVMDLEGYPKSVEELTEQINRVIKNTKDNQCSMLQDYLNHRAIEIEFITGYLLTCAKKHNIKLTEHESLYYRLKDDINSKLSI